jgi:hypothetical protein
VASAVAQGYAKSRDGAPTPYRGYYYHILTRQGKNAPGGAKSYIVNGKMTGGFAFVAYPAEYRSSGVMTFIVGVDGVVYQKDLGKKTAVLAKGMKEYNPDYGWQKTEEQEEPTVDPKMMGALRSSQLNANPEPLVNFAARRAQEQPRCDRRRSEVGNREGLSNGNRDDSRQLSFFQ